MSEISLQLAEFIHQLKIITEKEERVVENMIALMLQEEIDKEITFADGLSFGAFASFSILKLENEVKNIANNITTVLVPLEMSERMQEVTREEIFRPDVEGDLFQELERTRKKIQRRQELLLLLEKDLLKIDKSRIERSYSKGFLSSLKKEWERGLRSLLGN